MKTKVSEPLVSKKCLPCEGGVARCMPDEVEDLLRSVPGWQLTHRGERIRKDWVLKDFIAAIDMFKAVAAVAEEEGHHPDLHLEGYRNVWIEIWTHAIGGLSENDFILAAKIDRLPVAVRDPA